MPSSTTSAWPHVFEDKQAARLAGEASTFALAHGLLYLPEGKVQPTTPSSAVHAPISLTPAPIPRHLFERAQYLQPLLNKLYSRIALDSEYLNSIMAPMALVDGFVRDLWEGWNKLQNEGKIVQPLHLGLFRSDYLLHTEGELGLKQVEFNTISSSFGTLSERTAALHRHLHELNTYFGHTRSELEFPINETTKDLATGIAAAHKAYNVPKAKVLFVIQPNERNVFDQRYLEYELIKHHSIHVVRQTLGELATSATVSEDAKRRLTVQGDEISVVYFRAGYTPTDYPTLREYETRFLLESSLAIKCPTIPLQLAGAKRIQQDLTHNGVLERFLPDASAEEIQTIRSSWVEMFVLDAEGAMERARDSHLKLVLKPQREGGGNNIYNSAIPKFLDTLPPEERVAWIAMKLIEPPTNQRGYLLRTGHPVVQTEVISELGIFGWSLFKQDQIEQHTAGWLVRTKESSSNEGGVAAGYSFLDSVVLVDV